MDFYLAPFRQLDKWIADYGKTNNLANLIFCMIIFVIWETSLIFITIFILMFFIANCKEILFIVIIVITFIWTAMDKLDKKKVNSQQQPAAPDIESTAANDYPLIRSILFQAARASYKEIGIIMPIHVNLIEPSAGDCYKKVNNVNYFFFELEKADKELLYEEKELDNISKILQGSIRRILEKSHAFGAEKRISQGHVWDAVMVSSIQDLGGTFLVSASLCTDAFIDAEMQRRILNRVQLKADVPHEQWQK